MSKRHRLDIGDTSSKKAKEDDGGGGLIPGAPTEQDLVNIKQVRGDGKNVVFLSCYLASDNPQFLHPFCIFVRF